MAKIVKKKTAKPIIPPNFLIELKSVPTKILIWGRVVRERRGRKSLKVLKPLTVSRPGISVSKELTTTIKSSQFQASERYDLLSRSRPIAAILIKHSNKKTQTKTGSKVSTSWFLDVSFLGS
jgi:hypothetical protein